LHKVQPFGARRKRYWPASPARTLPNNLTISCGHAPPGSCIASDFASLSLVLMAGFRSLKTQKGQSMFQ